MPALTEASLSATQSNQWKRGRPVSNERKSANTALLIFYRGYWRLSGISDPSSLREICGSLWSFPHRGRQGFMPTPGCRA
jgi:hypothetical protein